MCLAYHARISAISAVLPSGLRAPQGILEGLIRPEEFFGRVQIFGDTLTLAKYCAKEWPSEHAKQALDEFMRNRGLN
jgi:hypothetical protein